MEGWCIRMNSEEALKAIQRGKSVRKHNWSKGSRMFINQVGDAVTVDSDNVVIEIGYRQFKNKDYQGWEIFEEKPVCIAF